MRSTIGTRYATSDAASLIYSSVDDRKRDRREKRNAKQQNGVWGIHLDGAQAIDVLVKALFLVCERFNRFKNTELCMMVKSQPDIIENDRYWHSCATPVLTTCIWPVQIRNQRA